VCADYALTTLFIIANGADYKLGLGHPPALVAQIGLGLYVVGEAGNFLHHRILASLRASDSDTKYMPPSGGLFELVAAPHYLFELVAWWGIGLVAMHWNALLVAGKKSIFFLSTFCLQTIILPRQAPDKRREISFQKRGRFLVAATMTSYLGGRSVAQNRWNRQVRKRAFCAIYT
jgi:steroid 5-alpha reductase family enzyme